MLHEAFRHLRACLGDVQLNYSWLYVRSHATRPPEQKACVCVCGYWLSVQCRVYLFTHSAVDSQYV